MTMHEKKYCPRCNHSFECKAGSISQCQCNDIRLTAAERERIGLLYNDCLCIDCLHELQLQFKMPAKD
ncbi:MAG: cysteine-rich CWC family protein [Bacteroidetes bacterium]|nr:cysteine-rich CWC family protein [Bacteroidota bacterium]